MKTSSLLRRVGCHEGSREKHEQVPMSARFVIALCPVVVVAALAMSPGCGAATPSGPSFSCARVDPNSIEGMICADAGLSALDRKLADVYAAASEKAVIAHAPDLATTQRDWVEGRDECSKSDDRHRCVQQEYERRIAELQIGYGLVPGTAPVTWRCDDGSQVVATYFKTDPPTLIARRGDRASLMFVRPGASGANYQGRNEMLWEHGGEARVTWGAGAAQLVCKKSAP
jgi:uncharacterized protein